MAEERRKILRSLVRLVAAFVFLLGIASLTGAKTPLLFSTEVPVDCSNSATDWGCADNNGWFYYNRWCSYPSTECASCQVNPTASCYSPSGSYYMSGYNKYNQP